MQVTRIWDNAPYNAFTDLIRHQGRWLCVLREGTGHAGDKGILRLIESQNGLSWQSLTTVEHISGDLRDPKLSITPGGRLMLNTFVADASQTPVRYQSLCYLSDEGDTWQGPIDIGEANFWLWRTCWHKDIAYNIGYCLNKERFVRLYHSNNGQTFTPLLDRLYDECGPSEFDLVFQPDDTCLCLLRRDNLHGKGGDNGLLGIARPPYTHWQWHDLGHRIGGPAMLALPDGRIVCAVRKYEFSAAGGYISEWLELCWLDVENHCLNTWQKLPSGHDCSYAGMVWHNDELWISYYSAHEEKPCIYLAHGALPVN